MCTWVGWNMLACTLDDSIREGGGVQMTLLCSVNQCYSGHKEQWDGVLIYVVYLAFVCSQFKIMSMLWIIKEPHFFPRERVSYTEYPLLAFKQSYFELTAMKPWQRHENIIKHCGKSWLWITNILPPFQTTCRYWFFFATLTIHLIKNIFSNL
jgi:hypothetical protein